MRLDKLPVGEAIVGFLLVALVATFIIARSEVDSGDGAEADGGSETAAPTGSTEPDELEITMTDNKFDHTELTLAAGAEVTIPLTNDGIGIHNVHVALDGDYAEAFCALGGANPCSDPERLSGGDSGTLTFTVPNTPGAEIPYRCDYHATEMTGTITVQ
jgi:plastocyanin